ncbi:MAG: hypothetical protein IT178_18570 [Acidobacteria bacterium]|nr:hypothetical protein [Acidobacteriota bacterium]
MRATFWNRLARLAPMLATLTLSACGGTSELPTAPSLSTATMESDFSGEWRGTVVPSGSITFTVSRDKRVTALTVNYAITGCNGRVTLPEVSMPITAPQPGGTGSGAGAAAPYFTTFFANVEEQEGFLGLIGNFQTDSRANGMLFLDGRGTCASTGWLWTANKR